MGRALKRLLVVAVVVVVAAGAAFWWFVVRDDAPPEAALPDRSTSTTAAGQTPTPAAGEADGDWVVVAAEETFAGFRIQEQFPGFDNTAVVRTPAVEGRLTVAGSTITVVDVTADLSELESQDAQPLGVPGVENRVGQLRGDGLETDRFPTATFTLTAPVELGAVPEIGATVNATADGDLTLHGVTGPVSVPIEARWSGEVIDVAGSLEIALADFNISAPNRQFVTVGDRGTLEFQLSFEPAGA